MNSENEKEFSDIAYQKFNSGMYKEAIEMCEKSIEADSKSSYPLFLSGCCEYALKNYSSGISFISKALELEKKSNYYSERAKCKYEIKEYKSAIDDLNYAIILERNLRYNYYWMGWCKYGIKDYKGAINELDTGINLENDVKDDTSKAFLFWLNDYWLFFSQYIFL